MFLSIGARRASFRAFAVLGVGAALGGVSRSHAQPPLAGALSHQAGHSRASPGAEPAASKAETSLTALLAYAANNAPLLRIARAHTGYAEAARAGAEPLFHQNPTLEVAAGPRFNGAVSSDFDFVAAISQPIEIAGERGARLDASSKLAARLNAELAVAEWEVRCNVVSAFNATVLAGEQLKLANQFEQFSNHLLEAVQRRLRAGDATAIQLRVAELDVVAAKQSVVVAEQTLRQAQLRLAETTGWSHEEPLAVSGNLVQPSAPPSLSALLAAAERHPALRAQQAAVADAHSRRELAEREGAPAPVVGVQVSREGAAGSPANYIVLGTLGVPLPLWQRNQQQRVQARVDEAVSIVERQTLHHAAQLRVTRAHAAMSGAYQRLTLFTQAIEPRLEESLALLKRGFEAGEVPLLEVTVARERFFAARRDALSAYAEYQRAAVDLEFAAGLAAGALAGMGERR